MSVSGITWNTETVMARYRELKASGMDGLAASRVVRFEFVGDIPDPRLSLQSVPTPDVPTGVVPTTVTIEGKPPCEGCGMMPREGRYRLCASCRKAAYRGKRGLS